MNIKEWIASIFPAMLVSMNKDSDSTRKAIINLVSIGELAKSGLDIIRLSDARIQIGIGSVMLGAYGEVLMAKFNIAKSELLSDEEILQTVKELVDKPVVENAKDIVEGKYKLPKMEER